MPTCDIFIKSYKPDFWLLTLSLETIKRNVTGYNRIILLIPEKNKHEFDTRNLPQRTLIYYIEDKDPGWLYQQVCKISAHKYSNADYIMFSDSDCFFDHSLNLQDLIADGKPEILYTSWLDVGDAIVWKKPTEEFMKDTVEWETMRRNNTIFHRSTLEAISKYAPDLENTIMSSERWSEFNAMGSYAMKYENDKYHFINTSNWFYVKPHAIQVWSHASKDKDASELHHLEYIRILETLLKSFGITTP